ncbi:MAG: phytanoyl-CoA dioxygenase family protein [Armatimonadetes bacterium]|nr:phytanoyl-CoA dioxygenase family protein [Armatimonadota bacterium]
MADKVARSWRESLEADGFAVLDRHLNSQAVSGLVQHTEGLLGERAGMRSLLEYGWGRDFVLSDQVQGDLAQLGYSGARCVRAILFDKHDGANWKVPWHQDRKIAVKERREIDGFRGWSEKEGAPHCQPTSDVLEGMVTLRYHLDDCGPENGPLKVVLGSHRHGLLTIGPTGRIVAEGPVEVCTCSAGGLVAMKPLLLHASSAAERVGHRRVLHLEFAVSALPGGLEWYWWV